MSICYRKQSKGNRRTKQRGQDSWPTLKSTLALRRQILYRPRLQIPFQSGDKYVGSLSVGLFSEEQRIPKKKYIN